MADRARGVGFIQSAVGEGASEINEAPQTETAIDTQSTSIEQGVPVSFEVMTIKIRRSFGASLGDPRFDKTLDLNNDNVNDLLDLVLLDLVLLSRDRID